MDKNIRVIVFLVAGAAFMEMLDSTVIVTALPRMGHVFGVAAVTMNLGITSYLLAVAVCLPASGWAAERFGVRCVFVSGLLLFTLASMLCALSQGLSAFVGARVLQGMGGSAMVSVGRLAVLRVTPKPQLIQAIGTIVWPGLIAPVVGPVLGGFLVTYASWRWIFAINLPLGVLAAVMAVRIMPTGRNARNQPLDILGLVLLALTLMALIGCTTSAGDGNADALPMLLASVIMGTLTWWHCQRNPAPLLSFGALRYRSFAVGTTAGSAFRIAIGSAPFLLPLFFQLELGFSAFRAGLLLLALFAGNLAMKTTTTRMLKTFGFRRIIITNGVLAGFTLAICAAFGPGTPVWAIASVLFISGLSRSLQFTALSTLQFAEVPQSEMGTANIFGNLAQQLSMGMGPAYGGLCLDLGTTISHRAAPNLSDFRFAFTLSAVLALIGVAASFRLARNSGQAVSGHSP